MTVDQIAVERACAGDREVRLRPAEVAAAYEVLEARGLSVRAIAAVLGVSPRTVWRWKSGESRPTHRRAA